MTPREPSLPEDRRVPPGQESSGLEPMLARNATAPVLLRVLRGCRQQSDAETVQQYLGHPRVQVRRAAWAWFRAPPRPRWLALLPGLSQRLLAGLGDPDRQVARTAVAVTSAALTGLTASDRLAAVDFLLTHGNAAVRVWAVEFCASLFPPRELREPRLLRLVDRLSDAALAVQRAGLTGLVRFAAEVPPARSAEVVAAAARLGAMPGATLMFVGVAARLVQRLDPLHPFVQEDWLARPKPPMSKLAELQSWVFALDGVEFPREVWERLLRAPNRVCREAAILHCGRPARVGLLGPLFDELTFAAERDEELGRAVLLALVGSTGHVSRMRRLTDVPGFPRLRAEFEQLGDWDPEVRIRAAERLVSELGSPFHPLLRSAGLGWPR